MGKFVGIGTTLSVSSSSGSLTIGQIRSISNTESTATEVDLSTLDSTGSFRNFKPGLLDPGGLTMDLVYDPGLSSHQRLYTYYKARTLKTWTVTYSTSGANTHSFEAFISGIGNEIPLDDLISASVSLRKSGDAGFSS